MRGPAPDPLLEQILRDTPRRYRLPAPQPGGAADKPSIALALAIEQVRVARAGGQPPDAALKQVFIDSLAALIGDARRTPDGDPAFQAMVLQHRSALVGEYAALAARRKPDTRHALGRINAIAHPARLARLPPGRLRDGLARLHACAVASDWAQVAGTLSSIEPEARRTRDATPKASAHDGADGPAGLAGVLHSPALHRLMRLQQLEAGALVRQYRALLDGNGPRAGSPEAAEQGAASRRRGAEVETLAKHAFEALAARLNSGQADTPRYRVVTSMRVPATLPGNPDRAKSEWDVALLKRPADAANAPAAWDVSLLVEAKASVDAPGTDLPRLLRGLRLLAQAEPGQAYTFATRQGEVTLRGDSLRALPGEAAWLGSTVLYCCDAPLDDEPRLLSAASRMQLLSAPESLSYAAALEQDGRTDAGLLEPIWRQLLETDRWDAVLQQLAMLRQARELMVHPDDLLAAIANVA